MTQRVSLETEAVEALSRMPECELAEGAPDVRRWEVTTPTSVHVGTVKDLLIDLATMRVRYLDVALEAGEGSTRRVLFPIGAVWINGALDQVVTTVLEFDGLPDYDPTSFSREFERDVLSGFGHRAVVGDDFYSSPVFDDSRFRRGQGAEVSCGRREGDAASGTCSADNRGAEAPEAANGVELKVVPEAAD